MISLRHDNTGPSPNWYVEKVTIRHVNPPNGVEQRQTFICNQWISSRGEEFNPGRAEVSTTPPSVSEDTLEIPIASRTFESSLATAPSGQVLPLPPEAGFHEGLEVEPSSKAEGEAVVEMLRKVPDSLAQMSHTEEDIEEGVCFWEFFWLQVLSESQTQGTGLTLKR